MSAVIDRTVLSLHQQITRFREENKLSSTHIADETTFLEWCEQLAADGLLVDGRPFDLHKRPALRFLYELVPSTAKEARKFWLVVMKGAQTGASVFNFLAITYFSLKFAPCRTGVYLPDRSLAASMSSERFLPILRTVPAAYRLLRTDLATGKQMQNEGNVLTRTIGNSSVMFLWTSGKISTESHPMDVIAFDEVQKMLIKDMEKTLERLSASEIKMVFMVSTAMWPDADIHYWYKKGRQWQFHTKCKCPGGVILDEVFPQCIEFNDGQIKRAPKNEYVFVCPACRTWIPDPQKGRWIAKYPKSRFDSVHYPQTLSATVDATEIIEAYYSADDMQNFYNRKLGKPYAVPSQVPITLDLLNACADAGKQAGVKWLAGAKGAFMGIDNMGGFSCAYLLERRKDGRMACIHVEAIYDINPWARLDELMEGYGVVVCVCEQLPNYDSAKQFAARWKGRVFLVSSYGVIEDDMVTWGDAQVSKADRKTAMEYRDRYTCRIDQYKMMSWALARITRTMILYPGPKLLTQEVVEKGKKRRIPVLKDMVWLHHTKTALVTEKDEEQHKMKRKVVKVGIDPHFSFAFMLACAAYVRAFGTTSFYIPDVAGSMDEQQKKVAERMPGLPTEVVSMLESLPQGQACGRCSAFNPKTSRCTERNFGVRPKDPGCHMFVQNLNLPKSGG